MMLFVLITFIIICLTEILIVLFFNLLPAKFMKIIAKYSVLFYNGDKGFVKETYNCPDFEDRHGELKLGDKIHKTVETALQQADTWVSEIDKTDMMNEKDIHMIFDWEIISAEKETQQLVVKEPKLSKLEIVSLWLKESGLSQGARDNFEAVYTKMYSKIKKLSVDKQISLTFEALGIAYDASGAAYQHMTDIISGKKKIETFKTLE